MASKGTVGGKAFKLEGIPELKKTLAALRKTMSAQGNDALSQQIRDTLLIPCMVMRDEAQDMAPEGETGFLKHSIVAKPGRGPSAYVAVDRTIAPYANFVERGTSKMPAQPFFRPAINATKPSVANMIAGGIGDVIAEAAKQNAWKAPA